MASPQEALIDRVRVLCREDPRVAAALTYGSFATGEGDRYSDIEFWLFFDDDAFVDLDVRAWCEQVAPVRLFVLNEFGTHVAIFDGLIRGEFHFVPASRIDDVRDWPAVSAPIGDLIIVDRQARLSAALQTLPPSPVPSSPSEVEQLCGRFVVWLMFGWQVLQRGEALRALHLLGEVHRYLLWMARLSVGATTHWLTPSRLAEDDLPGDVIVRYTEATAHAERDELVRAYRYAGDWGAELTQTLAAAHGFTDPGPLALDALQNVS
jgi:lincosamide nucleotidyltransferase